MSEQKILVPEGMLDAFVLSMLEGVKDAESRARTVRESWRKELTAALRWLSENPIVPNDEQVEEMAKAHAAQSLILHRFVAVEWQRRMFLAPELSVPEIDASIPDLLFENPTNVLIQEANRHIREAYRRGKEAVCQKP